MGRRSAVEFPFTIRPLVSLVAAHDVAFDNAAVLVAVEATLSGARLYTAHLR